MVRSLRRLLPPTLLPLLLVACGSLTGIDDLVVHERALQENEAGTDGSSNADSGTSTDGGNADGGSTDGAPPDDGGASDGGEQDGSVDGGGVDGAVSTCADPAFVPPTIATPATCAAVRAADSKAADGEYTLYAEGDAKRPWQAYCHDMAGTPIEYLPLPNTGSATRLPGDVIGAMKDQRMVNYSYIKQVEGGTWSTRAQTTFFDRLRIDPATLKVDVADRRFARVVGPTDFKEAGTLNGLPYGTASCCYESGWTLGGANVDLRGTSFAIAGAAQFTKRPDANVDSAGEAILTANDQVAVVRGGGGKGSMPGNGTCGWVSLAGGASAYTLTSAFNLALARRDLPRTCAEVLAAQPQATDAEYTLYAGGDARRPWKAYCDGMASGSPRDYLTLKQTSGDANASTYAVGGGASGTDVKTKFTRVRIDPVSLRVDITDRRFATSSGSVTAGAKTITEMPYGVAADCIAAGSATGSANIDLRGTPFAVAPGVFAARGTGGAGSATYSAADRVVAIAGGGACGRFEPAPTSCDLFGTEGARFHLGLVYVPLPETCAELKASDPSATTDAEYTLYAAGALPWTAFCADMATATPIEYLSVRSGVTGGNPNSYPNIQPGEIPKQDYLTGDNIASIYATGGSGNNKGTTVVTSYARVRIDPRSFYVMETDRRFSSSVGDINSGQTTSASWGVASDCWYSFSAGGRATVDVSDTPFALPVGKNEVGATVENTWNNMGFLPGGGTWVVTPKRIEMYGGGTCGSRQPRPELVVTTGNLGTPTWRVGLYYAE